MEMQAELKISSYCRITNERLSCDDQIILEKSSEESISDFLKNIYRKSEANYPKFFKMDLLCKAAFLAVEFISKKKEIKETNTPLVFSNRGASWASDQKHAASIFEADSAASPAVFVYTLPNIALGEISIRHQLFSENLFLIFEKFSPENLVNYTQNIGSDKTIEKVLAGWLEADENELDVLVYLVENEGAENHTIENITNLYHKK